MFGEVFLYLISIITISEAAFSQGKRGGKTLFFDDFNYSDGLLTNEYAHRHPEDLLAKRSPLWEMTSGSLFAKNNEGWTGVPDGGDTKRFSDKATNSAVFRMVTKQADFENVLVEFELCNEGLAFSSKTPKVAWDGVHIFLRYQSQYCLYYASVNRRDNMVIIKKKVPGGVSNGGTYYNLSNYNSYPVPYGKWQHVGASVRNNGDGSVTIELYAGGKLIAVATDSGKGGEPIRSPGKVGIRGDNAELSFKDFKVSSLP